MTGAETVRARAWPLSEAEITVLHARYEDEVKVAIGTIPRMPMPPLALNDFEALAFKAEFVGILKGLLLASGVPPEAACWLAIDTAAILLNWYERLQAGSGLVHAAGHA